MHIIIAGAGKIGRTLAQQLAAEGHALTLIDENNRVLENAVEHGIEPAGGGEIILRSIQAGSFLRLTVINSGKAPTEEGWQRIRQSLNGDNHHGQHIGLANISTRLRLIYGERAAIHVEADEQGRTVVRLDIPQSEEGDEACGVY